MHVRGATLVGAVADSHSARTDPSEANRYAAPGNGGDTGDAYLAGDRSPDRLGRSSRIHSARAPALGFHHPQLALPCVPLPTRSDRGRSRSSVARTLATKATYCQAPRATSETDSSGRRALRVRSVTRFVVGLRRDM
jgi:hypothetical protein